MPDDKEKRSKTIGETIAKTIAKTKQAREDRLNPPSKAEQVELLRRLSRTRDGRDIPGASLGLTEAAEQRALRYLIDADAVEESGAGEYSLTQKGWQNIDG